MGLNAQNYWNLQRCLLCPVNNILKQGIICTERKSKNNFILFLSIPKQLSDSTRYSC